MESTRFVAGSAAVLLISALIIFWGSATAPIRPDEAAYALLADHLRRGGNWLYLEHWSVAGRHYLDKPPVYFWLSAATEALIGFQPLAFRMWSGLFACGAVLCTIVVGRNLYDDATGLIAGLFLASNSGFLFALGARDGVLNTAIVFFVAAALATATSEWPQRRPRLAWFCLTLAGAAAGWTKPLNGLIVLAIAGAAALCYPGGERRLRLKAIALAVGPVLAANLLWPWLQWLRFGDAFLARFVGWNLLQRFGSGVDPIHLQPWYYYPRVIDPAMALGWLAAGWRFVRNRRAPDAIIVLVPLIYLAAISLTPSKLVHYAFPGFPLLAVAAAALIWQVASWLAPAWRTAALGAAMIALGTLGFYKVSRDLAAHPPQNWERPGCPASAEPGRAVEILLVGVSALDQVTAEARSRQLEFHLRRLGGRPRLVDAPTVRDVVQRQAPALIFVRRTGDGDLAELGLADRRSVGSFRATSGEPTDTQVFTIGLSPACS